MKKIMWTAGNIWEPGFDPRKYLGKPWVIMEDQMESTWEKVGVGKPWKTMKVEQTHWD